mmetsp:Transcript_30482/g.32836  ORF Transcript_30482/g.32836 Transcript_30482/m.32836 type:complete len:461 (-) Transcript_30482:152-1534(-)
MASRSFVRIVTASKKSSTYTFVRHSTPAHAAAMKRDTIIDDSIILEKRQKEESSYEDSHLVLTKETLCNDEDKYFLQIENGFMKVFMMPIATKKQVVVETPTSNNTNIPLEKEENESKSGCCYRNTQPSTLPETVLQFQRQLRKTQAAKRASTPLHKSQLQIIHNDAHIVVVNKPSGFLTVPGVNSNPSMLGLLYEEYKHELHPEMKRDHMIVHRLDMDTSGILIYAKTKKSMLSLQASFRDREGVSKYYEAIVCGHIHPDVETGEINLPLQRDHRFPPFMRVATPKSEREAAEVVKDLNHAGWKKIVKKKAKPSTTLFEVIEREYRYKYSDDGNAIVTENRHSQEDKIQQVGERYPVTRMRLIPITGRTHQLRVHCASIGHPILGDTTYGVYGEASSNGGFEDNLMDELIPGRANIDLQLSLDQYAKDKGQVMCLHARELRVVHPETGEPLVFEEAPSF